MNGIIAERQFDGHVAETLIEFGWLRKTGFRFEVVALHRFHPIFLRIGAGVGYLAAVWQREHPLFEVVEEVERIAAGVVRFVKMYGKAFARWCVEEVYRFVHLAGEGLPDAVLAPQPFGETAADQRAFPVLVKRQLLRAPLDEFVDDGVGR